MRVPLSWLREFVPTDADVAEIAHTLEMAGLGVEGVEAVDGDVVLDLEVTPNRGDWLSVYGVARELSAMLGLPLKSLEFSVPESDPPITEQTSVTICAPATRRGWCWA
jgi:phenylalanyl-tRNA synthetase beta chain